MKRLRKEFVLTAGYVMILINMILGVKIYSIDWAFLFFVLLAGIFYFYKIDSRFLILPAILLLGYCPFLLIAKNNTLAENIAIYAYYFLVVGVLIQIIENFRNKEIKLNFTETLSKISKKINSFKLMIDMGLVVVISFLMDLFVPFFNQLKYTSLYFFVLSFVFYVYKKINTNTNYCTY